jgi:hypothetical protein
LGGQALFRRRCERSIVVIVSALVLAGFCEASSTSFLIRSDAQIGNFSVKNGATLGAAVAAFGQPDTREFNNLVDVCTARWNPIGLRMVLVNFAGDDPCDNTGFFIKAAMRSPGQWETGRGLRIGSSISQLRELYPAASYHRSAANWWLISRFKAVVGGGVFPGLMAHVRAGRVVSFTVQVRP